MRYIFAPDMNRGLISIGSNKDGEANLKRCRILLQTELSDITFSRTSVTEPYGNHYRSSFLNQLAFIYTPLGREEVITLLKSIEQQMGRTTSDKEAGIVIIDIDLVIWNEDVLRPDDLKRDYITGLLPDLLQKTEDKIT